MKNASEKQAEPTNIIPLPSTVKPEETEEIIQIYEPTTRKKPVKLMIEEMDKSLNKKSLAIMSIRDKNELKLELQGELSGLRQVKVKCEELYKNMKNDLRPFASLSEQIEQDINGKKNQNKNPTSILKGMIRGLTEGRTFIGKVLSRTFTDDDDTPDIPPVIKIDKTRTKRPGTEGNRPKRPDLRE